MRAVTAYPRVVICYQVWPSASNPHPSTAQTQRRTRTVSDLLRKPNLQSDTIPTIPSASQYILRGRRIYSSVQGLSAIPQWRLTRLSLSAPIRIPVYFRRSQYSGDPVLSETSQPQITRVRSFPLYLALIISARSALLGDPVLLETEVSLSSY